MFKRIDLKIFAVIGSVVTLGLLILMLFYSEREERNILAQNKRTLLNVLDSTHQGLRTLMLSRYGDAGQLFIESLNEMEGVSDLRVMRPDGSQAFLDNQRIEQVNKKAGFEQFYPREIEQQQQVLAPTNSALQQALETAKNVEYYDLTPAGERLYTLLYPVLMEKLCTDCHNAEQSVIGVIKLTTSLKQVDADIASSRNLSMLLLCLLVLMIMLALSIFIRRAVVAPIQTITDAMREAASGDLSQRVVVPGQLELRKIADSFNQKIAELETIYTGLHQERNKLSTIILGAQEGMVATDARGQVVLVNPAAERLLDRRYEQVAKSGLAAIFDDPQWPPLLDQVLSPGNPAVAEIHHQGKSLHIQLATIANDQGGRIGTALLMRDITQEDALRQRLEHQSRTDPLTGLFNRRHFDQELASEFRLSQRYRQPVSLVLFDVDHFKRFNDDYGHDQGDRVLQQVAKTAQAHIREVDLLCRYGGEEFVIILPGADLDQSSQAAEQVRLALEAMQVDGLQVTCSFGVAMAPHPRISAIEALVKAADTAMYTAKQSGRNCVRAMPR